MRRRAIGICLALCAMRKVAAGGAGQAPEGGVGAVREAGGWEYRFVDVGRGTADERAIGKLSFEGKEVVGSADDRLATELGEFQRAGYRCEQRRRGCRGSAYVAPRRGRQSGVSIPKTVRDLAIFRVP